VRAGGVLYLSAGAATRDELYEPYRPPFADAAWEPAGALRSERHAYNERTDLPSLKPLAHVQVIGKQPFELPAIGARQALRTDLTGPTANILARFDDGASAIAELPHGSGKVIALGFLPMLAYGQLAGFKLRTLEEKWPEEPRRLAALPLAAARVTPIAHASVPVVEASLLQGPAGAALVLANYTYEPIGSLSIDVKVAGKTAPKAVSAVGARVHVRKIRGGLRVTLPLDCTDVVLLGRGR
jgi:hypothetical protein